MEYRYKLKPHIELKRVKGGVVAISPNPLLALRLNETAARLLETCQEWSSATQVAMAIGSNQKQVERTLAELAARRLLLQQPLLSLEVNENWPSVSVVVPVRNRPIDIERCMQSLRALDYPPDKLEIIVVDDASTDNTAEVVRQLPIDQAICMNEWGGAAACRNVGASVAKGEIIAYTDSDCEVTPGWLRELIPYFGEAKNGIVGGRVDSFSLDTAIERYESVASSLYMGLEERECRPNSAIPFLPTANLLIRRKIWQQLGGFDPAFPIGEDVDLVWRTCEAGYKVQYVPRGAVLHKYRCRLNSFVKRKAFYGGSETFLLRKHPTQRKLFYIPRQRVPFVALLLLGLLWPIALLVAPLVPLAETILRYRQLQRFGGHLGFWVVLTATARNYASMFLHLCGNIARYYGFLILLVGLFWWPLLVVGLFCFGYAALYDYFTRHPKLALPIFVGLYWLELMAHQVGMLGRCVECRTLRPMIPALKIECRKSEIGNRKTSLPTTDHRPPTTL